MDPLTSADPPFIGPHRLLARVGAGGMGRVYLARTPADGLVAVKVAHRDLAGNADFRARFTREVRNAQVVRGPYTPAVADADPEAAAPWMATEYVPGPTLKQAVAAGGPLPEASLPLLALGLAHALQAIHAAGIMHRDLKPGNVLLSPRGPQVIDFGIARAVEGTVLTRTGQAFGTPAYAAPETVLGEEQGPHSDVFALAGVVVFAATGRPAFGRGRASEVLRRVVGGDPDLDGMPEGPLRDLVGRCLAKAPEQRPSAEEIVRDLADLPQSSAEAGWLPAGVYRDIGDHEQQAHRVIQSVPIAPPARSSRSSHVPLVAGAAVTTLALISGVGFTVTRPWQDTESRAAPEPAAEEQSEEADEEPAAPPGHPDIPGHVRTMRFTPDGDVLHVLTYNNFTEWDWREGELLDTWDEFPNSYDLTPDGTAALGALDDVGVWEDHEDDDHLTYESEEPGGVQAYESVSLSPTDTRVAFIERRADTRIATVWDWEEDELVLAAELDAHPEDIVDILLSPDGTRAAVTHHWHSPRTEVIDVDGGDTIVTFPEEEIDELPGVSNIFVPAFSPDSDLIAVHRPDLVTVELYDLEEDETVHEFELPGEGNTDSLTFTPDGSRLLSGGGYNGPGNDYGGRQWDVADGEEISNGDTLLYGTVVVHPDEETIVVSEWGERGSSLIFLDPDTLLDTHQID